MTRRVFWCRQSVAFGDEGVDFVQRRGIQRQGEAADGDAGAGAGEAHQVLVRHAVKQRVDAARLEGVARAQGAADFHVEGLHAADGFALAAIEHFAPAGGDDDEALGGLLEALHDLLLVHSLIVAVQAFAGDHVDRGVPVEEGIVRAVDGDVGDAQLQADFGAFVGFLAEEGVDGDCLAPGDVLLAGDVPPAGTVGKQSGKAPHRGAHQPCDDHIVHYAVVLGIGEGREVDGLVLVEILQHGRDLCADVGAGHADIHPQGGQHGAGGAGFAAGEEVLGGDFGILIRLEETIPQQEGMGAQDLAEEIGVSFHGRASFVITGWSWCAGTR